MPSRLRAGPSPMPLNLPSVLANPSSVVSPNSFVRAVLPILANWPGAAKSSSKLEGRLAIAADSCRAPSGVEATPARPDRIAGTAPEIIFCALVTSEMPAPAAILAITSGFINSFNNGSMLPYIATSLYATGGPERGRVVNLIKRGAQPGLPQRLKSERCHVLRTLASWKSGRSCSGHWLTVDVAIEIAARQNAQS